MQCAKEIAAGDEIPEEESVNDDLIVDVTVTETGFVILLKNHLLLFFKNYYNCC